MKNPIVTLSWYCISPLLVIFVNNIMGVTSISYSEYDIVFFYCVCASLIKESIDFSRDD